MKIGVECNLQDNIHLQQALPELFQLILGIILLKLAFRCCYQGDILDGWGFQQRFTKADKVLYLVRCPDIWVLDNDFLHCIQIKL